MGAEQVWTEAAFPWLKRWEDQVGEEAVRQKTADLEAENEELEKLQSNSELLESAHIQDALVRAMSAHSVAYFASEFLSGPEQAPYNGRFIVADHHMEWDRLLHKHDRLCIEAPRDHSKTFFFDYALPLHSAVHQPKGITFIFSATQPQAERILEDIKAEMETNPKLEYLVPKGPDRKWSASSIKCSNGHRIYARGFGTKVRGAHPSLIIVDDGLNDETAYSEMVRNKQKDYFYTAITNMIIPGGKIVVVGTPFHGDDLYADIEANPEYCFRKFPALDENDRPLWPERYSKKRLLARKREIGNVRFTREFLCEPISDDMSLFPERLFRGDPVERMDTRLGMPKDYYDERGIIEYVMGVDFAISSSTGADYTVVFVLGIDDKRNRWIVDLQRFKGLEYSQQKSLINALGRKYDVGLAYLESNQMQRIFGDELINETDLPIRKFITTGTGRNLRGNKFPKGNTIAQNKNSLEGGVPALRLLLENGKIRIPRGDARSVELTEIWVQEMKSFTWLDGKLQGVGSHDDCVMAFWIACCAARAFSASAVDDGSDDIDADMNLDQWLEEQNKEPERDPDEGDPVENLLKEWRSTQEPEERDSGLEMRTDMEDDLTYDPFGI